MWVERGQRCGPRDVSDPAWPRGQSLGHVPNRRVRHAQQRQLGVLGAQLDAALLEARGNGRTYTTATDHVDALDHPKLQFRSGYRARRSLARELRLERASGLRPGLDRDRVPGRVAPL